jgi:hypothetical protein
MERRVRSIVTDRGEEFFMAESTVTESGPKLTPAGLSVDWWSVLLALAAAALVKAGVLPHIPW